MKTPPGMVTRPLLARIKKSLFDILAPRLHGARVLDVFAGAGSFGLEALSRGATETVLIESGAEAAKAIEDNMKSLGLAGKASLRRTEAEAALAQLSVERKAFDVVLLDPPFAMARDEVLLAKASTVTAAGGVVLLRIPSGRRLPGRSGGLRLARQERYGISLVGFYNKET